MKLYAAILHVLFGLAVGLNTWQGDQSNEQEQSLQLSVASLQVHDPPPQIESCGCSSDSICKELCFAANGNEDCLLSCVPVNGTTSHGTDPDIPNNTIEQALMQNLATSNTSSETESDILNGACPKVGLESQLGVSEWIDCEKTRCANGHVCRCQYKAVGLCSPTTCQPVCVPSGTKQEDIATTSDGPIGESDVQSLGASKPINCYKERCPNGFVCKCTWEIFHRAIKCPPKCVPFRHKREDIAATSDGPIEEGDLQSLAARGPQPDCFRKGRCANGLVCTCSWILVGRSIVCRGICVPFRHKREEIAVYSNGPFEEADVKSLDSPTDMEIHDGQPTASLSADLSGENSDFFQSQGCDKPCPPGTKCQTRCHPRGLCHTRCRSNEQVRSIVAINPVDQTVDSAFGSDSLDANLDARSDQSELCKNCPVTSFCYCMRVNGKRKCFCTPHRGSGAEDDTLPESTPSQVSKREDEPLEQPKPTERQDDERIPDLNEELALYNCRKYKPCPPDKYCRCWYVDRAWDCLCLRKQDGEEVPPGIPEKA